MVWLITVHADIVPVYGKPFKKPLFYSDTSEYRGDVMVRINGKTYIAFWKHETNKSTQLPACIEACLMELDEKMQLMRYISLPLKYLKNRVQWQKLVVHNDKPLLLFSTIDPKTAVSSWFSMSVDDMRLPKTAATLATFNGYVHSETLRMNCIYSSDRSKLLIERVHIQQGKLCTVQGYISDAGSGQTQTYLLKDQNPDLGRYTTHLSNQGVVWKVFTPDYHLKNRAIMTLVQPILRKDIFKWDALNRDSNGMVSYIDAGSASIQSHKITCVYTAGTARFALDKNGFMHGYISDQPDMVRDVIPVYHLKLQAAAQMFVDSSHFNVSLKPLLGTLRSDTDQNRFYYALNRLLETETGFICVVERSFINTYKRKIQIGTGYYNFEQSSNMSDAAIVFSHNTTNNSIEQSYCRFETPEKLNHSLEGLICFNKAHNAYVLAGETQYFPFSETDVKANNLLLEFPIYNDLKQLQLNESFLYTFTGSHYFIKLYRLGYESRFVLFELP